MWFLSRPITLCFGALFFPGKSDEKKNGERFGENKKTPGYVDLCKKDLRKCYRHAIQEFRKYSALFFVRHIIFLLLYCKARKYLIILRIHGKIKTISGQRSASV